MLTVRRTNFLQRSWRKPRASQRGRRRCSSRRLKTKLPHSLEQRLKALELTSMDPDVQQRAKTLRAKVCK